MFKKPNLERLGKLGGIRWEMNLERTGTQTRLQLKHSATEGGWRQDFEGVREVRLRKQRQQDLVTEFEVGLAAKQGLEEDSWPVGDSWWSSIICSLPLK